MSTAENRTARTNVAARSRALLPIASAVASREGRIGVDAGAVQVRTPLAEGSSTRGCVDVDGALMRVIVEIPAHHHANTPQRSAGTDAFFQAIGGQVPLSGNGA